MPFDTSIVGKQSEPQSHTYGWKDTALYALGIGAKVDELDYLYEGRGPDGTSAASALRGPHQKVFPSFAVVPTFKPMFDLLSKTGGSFANVVHGGQRVILRKPLAPTGVLSTVARVKGLYDLRKFTIAHVETETNDAGGERVFDTLWTIIFRGEGGFGGQPPPREPSGIDIPKDRAADFRVEEATTREQALLYRLSGDLNPLHADPEFAKSVGFEQGPILHGLCTYGHMVRHVARGALGGDATKLTGFEGSFKKPVWPGDTLVTEGWIVAPGKIALTVSVKERAEVVIGGAWATSSV
ncbi:MAG: MaoC/PaaZ C-terminal domain-containing protein [Polyangiaceae bacterium]|jgi:acyl dehydratase